MHGAFGILKSLHLYQGINEMEKVYVCYEKNDFDCRITRTLDLLREKP